MFVMNVCDQQETLSPGYDGYDLRSKTLKGVRFSSFQRQGMLWEQLRMAQSRDTLKTTRRIGEQDPEPFIGLPCLPFPRLLVSCLLPQRICLWQIAVWSQWHFQSVLDSRLFKMKFVSPCDEKQDGKGADSEWSLSVTASRCESQAMKRIQLETELVWGPSRKVGMLASN